jgi:hypothetical protein
MKMRNLVSFFAAASMVLSMSAFSVNAADENGITLEYVASDVATERIVKIYYTGSALADGVSGCELYFDIDTAVESYTVALPTPTSGSKFDPAEDTGSDLANGKLQFMLLGDGGVTAANNELATLTLTVPEGTGEFTVSIGSESGSYLFDASAENMIEFFEASVTIPGATVEEDKDPFVSATAEYLGRYDADKTSVPVDAWTATIDWSSYEAAKALNWTLSVNGEEKSVAAATQTEITGEMTVVYGLAIAGQAEAELNTIDKDNVVLK